MRDKNYNGSATKVKRQSFVDTGFESIQANLDIAGWSCAVRQLQGGLLSLACRSASNRKLAAIDITLSRTIEISGTSPDDRISIFAAAGPVACWLNGRSIDTRHVVIVPPGFEIMSLFRSGSRIFFAQIPVPGAASPFSTPAGRSVSRVELANFVNSVDAFVGSDSSSSSRNTTALDLLQTIRELASKWQSDKAKVERIRSNDRIIRGASTYIGEHIDESIRVGDLSDELVTSVSCLERTFRDELHMTPSQYILARRLVAAHKQLKVADACGKADGIVSRIALDHGFSHLGRFSGAYRNHFGELPSDTLAG